jgi:hypothetical protein
MATRPTQKTANISPSRPSWPARYLAYRDRSVGSLTPSIEAAGFDHLMARLRHELSLKNLIHLNIDFYFGDEWFCPDGTTSIAIPFWLADKTLMSIERNMMGFIEGGTEDEFMRLLRHEAGHCVEHAYRLSRDEEWKKCFGNPRVKYDPDHVKTIPGHPDYVENLGDGYAQTHPEEDFAETFAVWLDTENNCWERYRDHPVVSRKLMCVETLIAARAGVRPRRVSTARIYEARRMRRTLSRYYDSRVSAWRLAAASKH